MLFYASSPGICGVWLGAGWKPEAADRSGPNMSLGISVRSSTTLDKPWILSAAYQALFDHMQATSPMIQLPMSGESPFRGRPGPEHPPVTTLHITQHLVIRACSWSMPSLTHLVRPIPATTCLPPRPIPRSRTLSGSTGPTAPTTPRPTDAYNGKSVNTWTPTLSPSARSGSNKARYLSRWVHFVNTHLPE
jgi:hypothetical protein